MKKLIMSMGTVSLALIPAATLVSCGVENRGLTVIPLEIENIHWVDKNSVQFIVRDIDESRFTYIYEDGGDAFLVPTATIDINVDQSILPNNEANEFIANLINERPNLLAAPSVNTEILFLTNYASKAIFENSDYLQIWGIADAQVFISAVQLNEKADSDEYTRVEVDVIRAKYESLISQ